MKGRLGPIAGVLIAVVVASSGCSERPGQMRGVDAGPVDGGSEAVDTGSKDDADALASDALDLRLERSGLPLPPGVASARRILDSKAELAGAGRTKCSHQEPPSGNGDRWCAFSMPGANPDVAELWVINVTAAATTEVPACDGTSPACLRLTTTLGTKSANAFDGDTLIFYADAIAAPFVGPVYAWRPGWTQARQISGPNGISCGGHRRAPVAQCLHDVTVDPVNGDSVEMRVGYLDDPAGGMLPVVEGHWPFGTGGVSDWQIGFSPDGETFAISLGGAAVGAQNLRVIATKDVGTATPQQVMGDVNFWSISGDSQKIYFVRGQPAMRTLNLADFPGGSNVTTLVSNLLDYLLFGSGPNQRLGVLRKLDTGAKVFQLMLDPSMPSNPRTIFTYQDFIEGVRVSPDLRYTAWLDSEFKGRIVRHDDLSSCLLSNGDRAVLDPEFLDSAGLLFWKERSEEDPTRRDAFLSAPDGCPQKQIFARAIDFYTPIGDRGIILGDESDEFQTVTLKYAAISGDGTQWPADGPVRIHERVKTPVTLVGSQPLLIVFRTAGDDKEEAGTFVFGPVPF